MSAEDTIGILKGIALKNEYSSREVAEVKGLANAYKFIVTNLDSELTTDFIKEIHSLLYDVESGKGVYRTKRATSVFYHKQGIYIYSDPENIQQEMETIVNEYKGAKGLLHPLEVVARLKMGFINTHPFADGNGRMSRLLLNFALLQNGYMPIVIGKIEKVRYIQILNRCRLSGNSDEFLAYICEKIYDTYKGRV